jgi:glyoxylase-like metal-dependent hydrolase (beta-lactamase superfamily II)
MTKPKFQPLQFPFETPPLEGEAIEVAEGVLWMRLPLPMALDHVNIYALDEGDSWTIIDTGFDTGRTRAIWQKFLDGPLAGKPIGRILVTHHHPDHIGLAGWFQSDFGVKLWSTRTAWLFARMLLLDSAEGSPPETLAYYRSAGMREDLYQERVTKAGFSYADVVAPMPLGFRRIKQDDVLTIGGRRWTVHIGNGHAPEHATLWCQDEPLVIAGDQIIASISPNLGVYATEPEADPVGDWLEACTRLSELATDAQLVLPGHKLPFKGLPARMQQLIDNHHGALGRLLKSLDEPKIASECFLALFKRTIKDGEYGLALVESMAHLNHLHQQGAISRTLRDDGAWIWQVKQG